MLPALVLLLTVALACFALGVLRLPNSTVTNQPDSNENSFSGTYDPNSDQYIGSVSVVFASNAVYDGGLDGHRFNGHGVFSGQEQTAEGETVYWRFEGDFVEGRLEGEGTYNDHLGNYTGTFRDSLPDGQGVYTSTSGWRYEGEFQAGLMSGQGTVFLADGSSTSGTFEDGLQLSAN